MSKNEELWNPTHGNSNRFVALQLKTTGPDPSIHEIAQICVFPLNSRFELSRETIPFSMDVRPLKSNKDINIVKGSLKKEDYERIRREALLPQAVAELFDQWLLDKIKLAREKKLVPLTYDWPRKRAFLRKWYGDLNFDDTFGHEYRDLISIAAFCNDYADYHCYQLPYPKLYFSYLARYSNVEYYRYDDSILHVKAMTEIHRAMMRKFIPPLA